MVVRRRLRARLQTRARSGRLRNLDADRWSEPGRTILSEPQAPDAAAVGVLVFRQLFRGDEPLTEASPPGHPLSGLAQSRNPGTAPERETESYRGDHR